MSQITGCADRHPVFDRHGQPICVGDRLRAQVCTGPYGQTEIIEFAAERHHEPYGQINVHIDGRNFLVALDFVRTPEARLIAYQRHNDVEHAHEKWAEVIAPTSRP